MFNPPMQAARIVVTTPSIVNITHAPISPQRNGSDALQRNISHAFPKHMHHNSVVQPRTPFRHLLHPPPTPSCTERPGCPLQAQLPFAGTACHKSRAMGRNSCRYPTLGVVLQ